MRQLVFPKNDFRASGKPFNLDRPWLFQGAQGVIIPMPRLRYTYTVQFEGAPKGNYDLVSPAFLR